MFGAILEDVALLIVVVTNYFGVVFFLETPKELTLVTKILFAAEFFLGFICFFCSWRQQSFLSQQNFFSLLRLLLLHYYNVEPDGLVFCWQGFFIGPWPCPIICWYFLACDCDGSFGDSVDLFSSFEKQAAAKSFFLQLWPSKWAYLSSHILILGSPSQLELTIAGRFGKSRVDMTL